MFKRRDLILDASYVGSIDSLGEITYKEVLPNTIESQGEVLFQYTSSADVSDAVVRLHQIYDDQQRFDCEEVKEGDVVASELF